MNTNKHISLNFIDIFAGAGGMSKGLELAGHQCILGIEQDKYAAQTFLQNHSQAQVYCGDIYNLSNRKLKQLIGDNTINAVVGGPPCQGFSTVGLGNPLDKRNSLFMEFFRIVKFTKPEFIIIENVTGLVAKKNEKTLKEIFKVFSRIGYQLDVQVMSAEKYGVPEKRRRTIIIGSKINSQISFPRATHNTLIGKSLIPPINVGKALDDLSDKKGNTHNHDIKSSLIKSKIDLRRLKRIPEGKGIRYERDEKKYLTKSLYLDVDWQEMRENRFRQTKYFRLDSTQPSPTIMTHRHSYYHPSEHRYLTQREAARLQSFPNDFVFSGAVTSQWRQIGNAVPPQLAKALGKALTSMWENAQKVKNSKNKRNTKNQSIYEIRKNAFHYKESTL